MAVSRRTEEALRIKTDIMQAARQLLKKEEHQLKLPSLRQISERAGWDVPILRHHFGHVDELWLQVFGKLSWSEFIQEEGFDAD